VTVLSPTAKQKFFDSNGAPAAGYKLFTYAAGTATKTATYTDSTGGSLNANPIVLDYRGECNLWIPPNVAYKYVFASPTDTDPPGAPIWTIDNVLSSQLVTLYGGVDTGIANAYVLNFTANFTSYTDGIVIYWIPSNSNTGASTMNVNGLGVVNIKNQDGSNLYLGQIQANQVALIVYKGGQFILVATALIPTINTQNGNYTFALQDANNVVQQTTNDILVIYTIPTNASVALPVGTSIDVIAVGDAGITLTAASGVTFFPFANSSAGDALISGHSSTRITKVATNTWVQFTQSSVGVVSGTFAPSWFGFSSAPVGNLSYYKIGSLSVLYTNTGLSGTSNSTALNILNCPLVIFPAAASVPVYVIDNGAVAAGMVSVSGLSTLVFSKGTAPPSSTGFTGSGTKGLPAGFMVVWKS
jgi:hypothetical protein